MSSPLFLVPLIAANLAAPVHAREVRASGVVLQAAAYESEGLVSNAEIDVRARGVAQRIRLGHRDVSVQMLLGSVRIVDANFDGYPDIVVLRDRGAKWGKLDVFLYDPKTHRFSNDLPLAAEISRLSNVEFDVAHHEITTRDIGPSNPSSTKYVVDGSRLRIVDSCRFINPMNDRTGTLVRTHGAQATYTNLRLSASDVEPCAR
jgi:hypothetical protein